MLKIKSFVFSPIQENTYVLYNSDGDCFIIDPGCYSAEEKDAIDEFIAAEKLTPKYLLLTHGHLDHVFGNAHIAEKYELTPHLHKDDKPVYDYAPTSGLMYNLPFIHHSGEINYINEGDEIKIGNDTLKVILTPGHSPGHVSFYSKEGGFLISGDALFHRSIGRTDLPGGNHTQLIKSIKQKLLVLPPETKVYSGHGPATTIGDEIKENPFLQ